MKQKVFILSAFSLTALTCAGQADAAKTVTSPYVEEGKVKLEWQGGYDIDDDNDVDGAWKQKASAGYGVNAFWYTELEAGIAERGTRNADTEFSYVAWENKFQFTQPGQYWLDLGLRAKYEYNTNTGLDSVEAKLLLAKKTGDFSHLANITLDRDVGNGAANDTNAALSWGTSYSYRDSFKPGFEIYSDLGPIGEETDFDEQTHQVGPVAYGKLGAIKYDVGYLFGVSDAAPDGSLKAILKYDF